MSHLHHKKSKDHGTQKASNKQPLTTNLTQHSNPSNSPTVQLKSTDVKDKHLQSDLIKALATIETLKLEKENLKNTLMLTLERRIEKENNVDLSSPLSSRSKNASAFTNERIKIANDVERENKELKALLERNKQLTIKLQREKEDAQKKYNDSRQTEESNKLLKSQVGTLQDQLSTLSNKGDGLISPRADDNDFRQTLMGYYYETTQNLALLGPDHFARARFEQRFSLDNELPTLLEKRKYREIIMRGYKYINDLVRKLARSDGDNVNFKTLNKRASLESLSPRGQQDIYSPSTQYYIPAGRNEYTRQKSGYFNRDTSPERYNVAPRVRSNISPSNHNSLQVNRSYHQGNMSYDMRNIQSPNSQSFTTSMPQQYQQAPFYYPTSQNPQVYNAYSRNNSNAAINPYPGYSNQGGMIGVGYTPNQNINRQMYFSTPQTPQNFYTLQSNKGQAGGNYNTLNPNEMIRTEESDLYGNRYKSNLDRSDPNLVNSNFYDPSQDSQIMKNRLFSEQNTTQNTEPSRIDFGSNTYNSAYNSNQRNSNPRTISQSNSNPRSPNSRYHNTSPLKENINSTSTKRNKWHDQITEEELNQSTSRSPRLETKTSVASQISPQTRKQHKRGMAIPIQNMTNNLNKSEDISRREDRNHNKALQFNNTDEKRRDNNTTLNQESQFKPSSFSVIFGRTESGLLAKDRKNVFTGVDIPKKKKVENVKHQTYDVIKGEAYKEPRNRSKLRDAGTPKSKEDDLSSCERV